MLGVLGVKQLDVMVRFPESLQWLVAVFVEVGNMDRTLLGWTSSRGLLSTPQPQKR